MTTAYDAWVERDPARRAAEVDFGTTWTTDRRPGETWRLSWNTGSGELVAVTRTGDDVEVLGRFDSADEVSRTLPDWPQRALRPDGLDGALHAVTEHERRLHEAPALSPVYGMVLHPDGSTSALHEPVTLASAYEHLGTTLVDVARVRPDITQSRTVHMLVDDLGHAKGLPLNPLATLLYGSGWPILGTAVVLDDNDAPLPRSLSEGLNTDPQPGSGGVKRFGEPEPTAPTTVDAEASPGPEPGTDMDLS